MPGSIVRGHGTMSSPIFTTHITQGHHDVFIRRLLALFANVNLVW